MIVNDHYTTRGALRASQSKVFSLSKQRLDASNIAAIARIDTQDIAIVDEHGNLDGRAGFERCGFRAALDRIALESGPDGQLVITIEDDGPGLPEAVRETVLQRGVRADEAMPGSGLGLSIVADLAGLYGGSLNLETSPLGGLKVRLGLPGG